MMKMEKFKILMIESGSELEMGIPLNIALLVSAVKTAGIQIKIFSVNDYKFTRTTGDEVRVNTLQVPPTEGEDNSFQGKQSDMLEDFEEVVRQYQPDIVGLSVTAEPNYKPGIKLLNSIKEKHILTVVGGVFPTLCPEEVIKEDSVDIVCIGEGEDALVELCQSIQINKEYHDINNMWFKIGTKIKKNPCRPLNDLNKVPFQDWSPWTIPPRASKAMAGKRRTTALVELSRGCPFKCTFCANSYLNKKFKGNYREKSIDRFIEEIQYLQKEHELGFIYIADEAILTTSRERFEEFIEKYSKIGLPFWCQSRPEFIVFEKMEKLKKVGLQAINIGIESGNFDFRKKILNRNIKDETMISGIRDAIKAKVRVGANAIIGFPGETRSHVFETIELVREARPTSTMVHLFQPYKKTPLREESVKMGLINKNHICGDYRLEAVGTGVLSASELIGLQRTFNLYVDLPKNRWDEIKTAEAQDEDGNIVFARLAKEYQLKHFGLTSF